MRGALQLDGFPFLPLHADACAIVRGGADGRTTWGFAPNPTRELSSLDLPSYRFAIRKNNKKKWLLVRYRTYSHLLYVFLSRSDKKYGRCRNLRFLLGFGAKPQASPFTESNHADPAAARPPPSCPVSRTSSAILPCRCSSRRQCRIRPPCGADGSPRASGRGHASAWR